MLTDLQRDLVEQLVSAVRHEVVAQQKAVPTPLDLEDGKLLHFFGEGGVYEFSLVNDAVVAEGAPVSVKVGNQRWDAELLHRRGLKIVMEVRRDANGTMPQNTVRHAELLAEPWFLTKALLDAVADLGPADWSLPARQLLSLMLNEPTDGVTLEVRGGGDGESRGLNAEQLDAVANAGDQPVWFVWGPPGTGKTSTLGHLVADLAGEGETVLVVAQSNVAVDTAALAALGPLRSSRKGNVLLDRDKVVRAGPAVTEKLREESLSSREITLRRKPSLARNLESLQRALTSALERGRGEEVRRIAKALKDLVAELKAAERDVVNDADIVFCTLAKLVISPELAGRHFDAVIVDEASMALPPQVLFAATRAASRCAVFGDYQQLPPIVATEDAPSKQLLDRDVFRACRIDQADEVPAPVTMLREQYRMHPSIRELVSDFCYLGQLRDGPGVVARTGELAAAGPIPGEPVLWLNSALLGAKCQTPAARSSRFSIASALASTAIAFQAAEQAERVVLLAPYRAQVKLMGALLRDAGRDNVQLGTVHRFQGAEAATVILDLVDAPPAKLPGQLLTGSSGERLVNVGISRAQGKLVVAAHPTLIDSSTSEFRRTSTLLQRMRARQMPALHGLDICVGELELSFRSGAPGHVVDIDADHVVTCWGDAKHLAACGLPPSLLTRSGADNHMIVVLDDNRVAVGVREPSGDWGTWVVRSSRFANMLSHLMDGGPIRGDGGGKGPSPDVVRHDRCAKCGEEAELTTTGYDKVILSCTACSAERWPTLAELETWARMAGVGCPNCGTALRATFGQYGPFLGCPHYPKCQHIERPRDLVGLRVVPEDQWPKPPAPKATRKPRSRPKDAAGRDPAKMAAFNDYTDLVEDAGDWYDLGFTAEWAAEIVARGGSLDEARRRIEAGETPGSIWVNPFPPDGSV
jgi:hypothetical protein